MKVPWTKDELLVLLKKYSEIHSGDMHKNHPEVIKLSNELRNLPINFKNADLDEKFRNSNGVALKFANFLSIDPKYLGKGMKGASKLDRIVFEEYFNNITDLDKNIILEESSQNYTSAIKDHKLEKNKTYPYEFKKWFSSNLGGVRLPMNNKTGRPMGDQIIEGKIHNLIKEMIIDFKSKKGKFLCVLVGGPGNGKTDLMEFTSEMFFNTFNIDINIGKAELQKEFKINNRKASFKFEDVTLNLIQDASQRELNDHNPVASLFKDFEELDNSTNALTLICINRGVLESVYTSSKNNNENISKHNKLIQKIHSCNNIQSIINDTKIWGDQISDINLYTWSMDYDTLFFENETINSNLIHSIISKSNCLNNFTETHELSPINVAYKFLNNDDQIFNLSKLLRSYEIINGKRFTYREIFSLIAHLFYHSKEQNEKFKKIIDEYNSVSVQDSINRFNLIFQLYKYTPNYRLFNYFIEPQKELQEISIKPYIKDVSELKDFFKTLSKVPSNNSEVPVFIKSKACKIFDPLYYDDNFFSFNNDMDEKLNLKYFLDSVLYNQEIKIDNYSRILNPLEIELIKIIEQIKSEKCINIDPDKFNTTQLNGIDSFKTFLNNLLTGLFKRALFVSDYYIKDSKLINEYLDLINIDSSPFIYILQDSITVNNKIENSLTTKIGQTSNELTNNVIEKNRITRISSISKPNNVMPKSDQMIFEYDYNLGSEISKKYIVITFNLFKSIKKNSENIFPACLDKNYLMWKELKKIELSERNNNSTGEIFIPDMEIKLRVTKNPFKVIKID
jgi:hypothetical protein